MNFKLTSTLIAVFMFSLSFGQNGKTDSGGFDLKGNLPSLKSTFVVLGYYDGVVYLRDTAKVINGQFKISGKLKHPSISALFDGSELLHEQYIENSKMVITQKRAGDPIEFRGSVLDKENNEYQKSIAGLDEVSVVDRTKKYIQDHPQSFLSLIKLNEIAGEMSYGELKNLFGTLDDKLQNNVKSLGVKRRLSLQLSDHLGKTAIPFTQKSDAGMNVSLSDYKGKYVLVDFWASWCAPCRAENPNVLKSYNQYKSKNFDVLSVALDSKEDRWRTAIAQDKLPWAQVSDLRGWENEVAGKYNIYSIPSNFLVDSLGTIVAINLRGEALDKKLAEIFNPSRGFELSGNIFQLKSSSAVLSYEAGGKVVTDTAKLVNGNFSFAGKVDEPTDAMLISPDNSFRTWIFLENNIMTIHQKDSGDWIMVSGSRTEDSNRVAKKAYRKSMERMNNDYEAYAQLKKVDSAASEKQYITALRRGDSLFYADIKEFIIAHPESMVSAYELNRLKTIYGVDEVGKIYEGLDSSVQQSLNGKRIGEFIKASKNTAIGTPALNFRQKNLGGKDVSLSDFKGQYVLIDFWASWCMPCRRENPNVVKAYSLYRKKGFQILGVSLDENADQWKAAIKKDKLSWEHVSDLKGWKNEVSALYGVSAVPTNFLVDPKGIIIAKNLRGEELQKKLADIFN